MKSQNSLPDEELQRMRKQCVAATPGPWKSYVEGRDHTSGSSFIMTGGADIELTGATEADHDFIAHARQDMPQLLEELHRLRQRIAYLENSADSPPSEGQAATSL
ncbi:MAG: ead/Ea22-like family protein [Candidatus Tectomicrobia bacterium]|nr:ead/Ea22-like family protein [Candidatus Tectomicrobia bacterium]